MIDEVLMSIDGIDLFNAEMDLCFEATQKQDQASKIERTLHFAQGDTEQDQTSRLT